jgi:hypothetical protein
LLAALVFRAPLGFGPTIDFDFRLLILGHNGTFPILWGGEAGETLAATKGFIVRRAREFLPPGQNVRLCERVRKNGGRTCFGKTECAGRSGREGGRVRAALPDYKTASSP